MDFKLKNVTLMVFTDIDGTFIDNDVFCEGQNFEIAKKLVYENHILAFNSSKTFEEIKYMQKKSQTFFPFICETGGGIYYTNSLYKESNKKRDGYSIMFESRKIEEFRDEIKNEISINFNDDLDFFEDFNETEKSALSGLSGIDLELASKRDFSILIRWKSNMNKYKKFESTLSKYNLNIVKGGRFSHICGNHNKGKAVTYFLNQLGTFRSNEKFISVGIGDSTNDLDMLEKVDYACIVKSKNNADLIKKIQNKNIIFSENNAPDGWVECIQELLSVLRHKDQFNV